MTTSWAERQRVKARVLRGQTPTPQPRAARRPARPASPPDSRSQTAMRADAGTVAGMVLAKNPEVAGRLARAIRAVAAKDGPDVALGLLLDGLDQRARTGRARRAVVTR